MFKPLIALVALLALPLSVRAQSTPTFRSFDTNDFSITLGAPPTTIAKIHALRSGVTNIFNNTLIINTNVTEEFFSSTNFIDNSVIIITNTFISINGNTNIGVDLWTNSLGFLLPVDSNVPVRVPHLLDQGRFSIQQHEFGMSLGTNFIDVSNASLVYLQTPETNATLVVVNLSDGFEPTQYLDLFSFTNYNFAPSGQWTLPANSSLPGGGLVRLFADRDFIGGNGRGISLRWIQPNWVEIGRWDVFTGVVGLGESLWTNNAGVLQPLDLALQPMIEQGLAVGTNSTTINAGPLNDGTSFYATRVVAQGNPNFNQFLLGTYATLAATNGVNFGGFTLTNYGQWALGFANTNDQHGEIAWKLNLQTNGLQSIRQEFVNNNAIVSLFDPSAIDGDTAWQLGTVTPHTTGNLLEVANAGAKQLSLGVNGALALGPSSYSVTAFDDPTERLIFSLADTTKGESDYWQFRMGATSHTNDIEKGSAYSWLSGSTNAILWINQLKDPTGAIKQYISFGLNPESHGGFLSSGFGMGTTNREVTTLNPYSVAATVGPVVMYLLDTEVTQTNKSLKLLSVQNNQNERFGVTQAGSIVVPVAHTPASSSETNYVGAITWDSTNIYVWTATNVNKRAALSTW